MKKIIVFGLMYFCVVLGSTAQQEYHRHGGKMSCPVCKASGKVERSRIPPPQDFLLKSTSSAKSDIQVDYIDFSAEAQAAFAYAVSIWESIIESDMPIRMKAIWRDDLDANVLGSCGPETYYSNFKDAPYEDRYYPVAIAEKISKKELNGASRYDIEANFSRDIAWYYGTDLNCPDSLYDFVSVVLHEIGHGLGFTGFFFVDEDLGAYGFNVMGDATSFDLLVHHISGNALVDTSFYDNSSTDLKKALESSNLYANSPVAKSRNNGAKPRLYAPKDFDNGSSIYHLNDFTYQYGNVNSLMTHAVGRAEAIHDPGPLTRGIMDDMGWRNLFIRFDPPKDKEQIEPIRFTATFESDYRIDPSTLMVVYSLDDFQLHRDTLALEESDQARVYTATLNVENGTESVSYYVQAGDVMNRIRTSPSLAPTKLHSVKFGPDTEKPIITHTPIPYFLLKGDPLLVHVEAEDNLGIDTVYISYSINDIAQTSVGLTVDAEGTYSGVLGNGVTGLKDGDVLSYAIFARDSSGVPNSSRLPQGKGTFSFQIQEIFDPVTTYNNDFDGATTDFLISDFDIYTESGFENGALHSKHPYESTGVDNEDSEFFTFLKRPVILVADGTMAFDEVVLVEPGESGAKYGDPDFWDYVIVEGSKDFGESWKAISEGYDSGLHSAWSSNYNVNIVDQNSQTQGSSEMFFSHEISLLETENFAVGDTVLIRFRLYSDPYANGWGWAIDNLQIQQPLAAGISTLAASKVMVYPNPFKNSITVDVGTVENVVDIQIEMFDMFGRRVYTKTLPNIFGELKERIDLTHLKAGMFLVKVSENGKPVKLKKLIKN